ncbi:B3 domain-containing transcription repressor VAL2 isoform X2 [Cryptomeria japonica]|uniref:B3 domain-containing transcription repressor VAL2 isoform X2 n=1 Tax=Cryptomeria japonica TaxID=3369 RepID=UPI0027DA6515|nr:B3 domain-containing transcription repressor VAL2 isoform X2 [Cryptomeria japonica]
MGEGSKVCFNEKCGASLSARCKSGWPLRSGKIAELCDDCGSIYDQKRFCDTFHLEDEGWRTCNVCNKRIHCGCIASAYSFSLVDTGGIECVNCASKNNANSASNSTQHPFLFPCKQPQDVAVNSWNEAFGSRISQHPDTRQWLQVPNLWQSTNGQSDLSSLQRMAEVDRSNEISQSLVNNMGEQSPVGVLNTMDVDLSERIKNKDLKLGIFKSSCQSGLEAVKDVNVSGYNGMELLRGNHAKQEGIVESKLESDILTGAARSVENIKVGLNSVSNIGRILEVDNNLEEPASSRLNISLGSLLSKDDPSTAFLGLAISSGSPDEVKELSKVSAAHPQRQRRQILPKPLHASPSTGSDSSKDMHPQIRVARPPVEGRGRNQLLPRYWPRSTDQELQQISGDSNSVITPLFEKMLSASDAGRIGRLVLPKACAEAYFPPISQPEGLPIRIQDAKGKDWVFQFRFWPNNNSRMYVLEGVTPCIQSMQLQAGDTVTFSRIDPEGKLVMGFRKASNSASPQEAQPSTTGNGTSPSGGLTNGSIENVSALENFSGFPLQSIKGDAEANMNAFAGQFNVPDAGFSSYKINREQKPKENPNFQSLLLPDKRKSYTLGSKSKRLRIDNEDSLELKLTWEEAQDLLCPPPSAVRSVVMIEGHEFEEYEEPPVFGKKTIFTTNQSGEKDQWAQCDECSSWRRLPVDAFLPPRWTCADNTWDPKRSFCSTPQEMTSEELGNLLQLTTESRKVEPPEGQKITEVSSGLDTLANVAALGEGATAAVPPLAAATTKHPRHRPGCTCIVCIQPPSGKGPKHKPTCTCNVCMTVKRRFKTLMMRRKKRQSEREAENAKKKRTWTKEEGEVNSGSNWQSDMCSLPENFSRLEQSTLAFREGLTRVNNFAGDEVKSSSEANLPGYEKGPRINIENSTLGKGQIDLNSHPARDEDPSRAVGRVSMMRLLQDASLPLDMYLKQHGLTSLLSPQQVTMSPMGFEMSASEQRVEQNCTPSNAQNQDQVQEEQLLTANGVKNDVTSVST